MAGTHLLMPPATALHGLMAHFMAEALLNLPRLLGSLQLLGNPAGLVDSLTEGLQDFLALSLTARSPSTVSETPTWCHVYLAQDVWAHLDAPGLGTQACMHCYRGSIQIRRAAQCTRRRQV